MFALRSIMSAVNQLMGETPPGSDINWNSVVGLYNFNSSQTNNLFVDRSSYSGDYTTSSVTLAPSISNFSPFSNQSIYFNGSSSYITATVDSAFAFGTADFTVEMWFNIVNPGGTTTIGNTLISNCTVGTDVNYFQLAYTTASKLAFVARNSTNTPITGNTTLTYGIWHHVAVVRNAGTFYIYLDGVLEMQQASSVSITQRNLIIGGFLYTGYNSFAKAHIYQVHVTNNAKYTTAFTPSANTITPTANTILLTAYGPKIKDLSSKNLVLTLSNTTGSVTTSTLLPPGAPILDTSKSAFVYNNGTYSQNLKINTSTSNFLLPTSTTPWTLEAFVYLTEAPTAGAILCNYSVVGSSVPMVLSFGVSVTNSNRLTCGRYAAGWVTASAAAAPPIGQWIHVAGTFDGSVLRTFQDGVLVATSGATTCPTTGDTNFSLGRRWDTTTPAITGFIAFPRVTVGQARYTSTFTAPTAPLQSDANTKLLLDFEDQLSKDFSISRAGIGLSAGGSLLTSKWNNKGLRYTYAAADSAKAYGIINTHKDMGFGLADFTIEFWLKRNTATTMNSITTIFDSITPSGSGIYPVIQYNNTHNIIYNMSGANRITSTNAPLNFNWQHIALCRVAGVTRLFVDGVQVGSNYADTNSYVMSNFVILGHSNTRVSYTNTDGIIEDVRITRGVGRYSVNFTVPSAPFYYEA